MSTSPFDARSGAGPGSPPTPRVLVSARPPAKRAWDDVYLPVPAKFALACGVAIAWMLLSVHLSRPWLDELSTHVGYPLAIVIIAFIAYVPGFMNAFLIAAIVSDRRPPRLAPRWYPPVDVLVACYQEADNIRETLASLVAQASDYELDPLLRRSLV